MKAMLTLSLGGTYPAPPSTRRGTIEKPIAAAVACPRNLRREIKLPGKLGDRRRFFTVPPAAPTAYCKPTGDLLARKFAIPRLAAHCRRMTGLRKLSSKPNRTITSGLATLGQNHGDGWVFVSIPRGAGRVRRGVLCHRRVCDKFVGEKPAGYQPAARCSQNSSQRPLSWEQRRAIIAFAWSTVQRIPDCFSRCPMIVLQPASTTPEPTKRPWLRNWA